MTAKRNKPLDRAGAERLAVEAVEACPKELLDIWWTFGCKAMKNLVRAARALEETKS